MSDIRIQRQPNKKYAPVAIFLHTIAIFILLGLLALSGSLAFGLG
jgi:hypothetical protein